MAKVVDFCRRNLAWVLLLLICVVFTFTSQNFLTLTNLLNILNQNAYVIISAYGIALIMMSGGLDMAVGYQMSICGVLCAMMIMYLNVPIVLAVLITVLISVVFGMIGTLLEQLLQLPRIFVSIGLSTVYQGIAYVITNSKTISSLPPAFKVIGQGTIFHPSLTYATIFMVIAGIFMSFVMDRTYFGRYVFALGGNEAASRLAGINVKKMKYAIGGIAGLFCGIGAVVLSSRVGAAAAGTAAGTEITVLTGVLVGGVSVRGGEGKIANCVAGVLIMGLLANGIVVYRDHDRIHGGTPSRIRSEMDMIFYGIMKELGWEEYCIGFENKPLLYEIPETTAEELAGVLVRKLNLTGARIVGDYDVMIPFEIVDWTVSEYVRDSAALGRPRALIEMGHFNVEEAGMRYMEKWLPDVIGHEVPVTYVQSGDSFSYILNEACIYEK